MIKKLYRCFVYAFILLFIVSCQNQIDMREVYSAINGQKDGITFTITYKNVDGLDNPNPTKFSLTEDVSLQVVLKDGYGFEGWYTSPSFEPSTKVSSWKAYEKTSDVVLYAKFVKERFTIIYNNVDGLYNPNSSIYSIKEDVTLLAVNKDGYDFDGWYTSSSFAASTKLTGWKAFEKTGDITLYAKFVKVRYNITYYNVGGVSNPNPRTYNIKNPVTLLPLEKSGYLFLGWYTNSSFTPESKIEGWAAYEKQQDMYLYANFKQVGIYMDHRVIIFKGTTDSPVTLIPTVVGYDNSNPVWTSLDTDVAIVQDGVVSPVNYGITTVKYETDGGAAYVFIIVMQDYANTTYDSGTVPVENGYYTNSANVVSYSFQNGRLDFRGRLTNSSNWCQTTCGNGGWTWNVNGTSVNFQDGNNTVSVGDIDLTVIPVLAYDSATNTSFVVIYQMLTNTSNTKITGAKMASHSDTMLANNDRANIMPKAYGARMYDPNTKLAFDMYCLGGDDCTPVDTLWYGYWSDRQNHLWDGTVTTTHIQNTDTGMCYGWMNIDIEPGETVLRSIRMTLVEYDPNNP